MIKEKWPFFTIEVDNPSSNSVNIYGKQMDKIRRIVHPKLRPFHIVSNSDELSV